MHRHVLLSGAIVLAVICPSLDFLVRISTSLITESVSTSRAHLFPSRIGYELLGRIRVRMLRAAYSILTSCLLSSLGRADGIVVLQ
jgi:hypothetical protein